MIEILTQAAAGLLQQFGQIVEITPTQGIFDPTTQTAQTPTATPYKGWGAAFNFPRDEIDGRQIVDGDVKIYVERLPKTPTVGDTIRVSGRDLKIKAVQALDPSGAVIIYQIQAGAT